MGGKQSKNIKRYRVSNTFGPVRWNYEDQFPIDRDDPMHDPAYNLQGEPDTYINEPPPEDQTDIWVPREGSGTTCVTIDDDAHTFDDRWLLDKETVLNDTVQEDFPQDHYDMIHDSDIDQSETDLKRTVSVGPDRDPLRPYHKLPKRRHDYEQMVKIFQPLIVTNVVVRRLLPHLPFLSDPGRIRAVEERDPRAAGIYLIDELCSNRNTEPGRWKQFIQALERCGYKYIVETLRGQEPVDHTYQREYLKIITPVLRDLINPCELLPILWAVDVISNEDKEEIGQMERNWGTLAAADKLLDMVPRRHRFWYAHLVEALKKVGRTDAADILAIPEILNSEEEKKDVNKGGDPNAKNGISPDCNLHRLSSRISQRDENVESYIITVPDNCEYLDCDELYDDYESEELDEIYLQMHRPNLSSECKPCDLARVSRRTAEVNETELYDEGNIRAELLAPNSLSDTGNTFPLECSLTNVQRDHQVSYNSNEFIADVDSHNVEYISVKPTGSDRNRRNSEKNESETNNRSDLYRYEPPLPASTAPGTPGQQNFQATDNFDGEYEIDDHSNVTDDSSETEEVEVVKLSIPERRKSHVPEHTPKVKALNKPPIPTPRKRTSQREITVPTRHTALDVQPVCAVENEAGISKTSSTEAEVEEDKKTKTKEKLNKEEQTHLKNIVDDARDKFETLEEERESTKCADTKQLSRAKVKASILKRKKLWRKFQSSKMTSRRKPLQRSSKLFQQNHTDALCLNLEKGKKGKALVNREHLLTPRKDRDHTIQADEEVKSKSLPKNIRKALTFQDSPSSLKETTGKGKRREENRGTQRYYSEPFRCHRGKEDEDIFTTVGQVLSNSEARSRHPEDILKFQPLFTAKPRRMSETDELLDILESCNENSNGSDRNLKSNAEIITITKENLNPDLRKNLEKVKYLESKLNHLVHDRKVLERRLQLQEDVNEILKCNRHISSKLSVKEKEAKALEAAISGDTLDPGESDFVPEYSPDISKTGSLTKNENNTFEKENIMKDRDHVTEDSKAVYVASGKLQLENIDKDSAFCSEFTTKL